MSPRLTKPVVHGRDHAPGGSDPIPGGTGGHVIKDEGVTLPKQPNLNFVGAGVTATDDPVNSATKVTIPSGGTALAYGAATVYPDPSIPANFSGLLTWTQIHTSGVTISGTNITIATAGTYEIHAAGGGYLQGPAAGGSGYANPQLEMQLNINGGIGAVPHYGHPLALSPMDIPSGRTWIVPMTLLGQQVLAASDVLTLRAINACNVVAYFTDWRIVVRQMA